MGTPDFAVESLRRIHEGGYNIVGVVTMPDKPAGRGHKLLHSPVKQYAVEHGLHLMQPPRLKADDFVEELRSLNANLFVVIAFRMLPEVVWSMPELGTFNLHASLLPKYRGAAPIQWCIINGETVTGVTTMQMNAGLDTGDMLAKEEVIITDSDTGETLHDKLAAAGVNTIRETIKQIEAGTVNPIKQDDNLSCYAPMINKTTGYIDFTKSAREIYNLVRALISYPYASTTYCGTRFKLINAKISDKDFGGEPGEILDVNKDGILVKCGTGTLLITDVQFEGKKKMPVSEYIKGNTIEKGIVLGENQ